MMQRRLVLSGLGALLPLLGAGVAWGAPQATRIVSIGGALTETVFALGQEHRLVARDTTSTYPAAALELPNVGYARALAPEGVLSVAPDLILVAEGSGPPETLEVLRAADIPMVTVPEEFTLEGIGNKIRIIGAALGTEAEAERLAESVTKDVQDSLALAHDAAGQTPKRVLFVLSAQGGRIMAGGVDTAADGMIRMAGAVNAAEAFSGYKPMTDEAVLQAAPDVVLAMDRGGDHAITAETLLSLPALKLTPAADDNALVLMNGMQLLGYGPRTGDAVRHLAKALYPSHQG